MGKTLSKLNERLRSIDREVSSLKSNFLGSNRKFTKESKDQLVETLVKHSNEVNSMRGKVHPKHLEQVQNNISHTMEDVLSRNTQESDLDMAAIETHSFVQVHPNKRQMSNKTIADFPNKKQKGDFAKSENITLQDIEEKLKTLKPQINVAIEQADLTQLRVQQNTIEVLATNLDMINVKEETPLGDKKKRLDKSTVSQYRKITKAMQEIRRQKDINYLVEQNKRILSRLEDIQRELSDVDSVVLKLSQNSDQSVIRENLSTIKQRLLSIEAIDESTKQKQVQLMKKHAEIFKKVENIKESNQSDLTKAQMNYEEIIKNIASGHSIDKDEIKVKLQSLQSFINSIKDDSENTSKGKQQLLTNVRQSFSFILDQEPKIENTVPFSNKQDSSSELSVQDFYKNWKTLQKNITLNSLSDWSETDKILNEIQHSIQQKRQEIAELPNLALNRKLNYSTPNLSSPTPQNSAFGSNLSVDHVDQSFIKTTAKVYNLSTPQIQNISDQEVVLRNKKFYANSLNSDDRRPFSKLEEVKTQLHYIKEKFEESPQKQHLKNKLESYIEIIGDYIHHKNQRIANNAKILSLEIKEMLKRISEIPQPMNDITQRRSSIELPFENIVGIQESVEQLEEAVARFDGKKGDTHYKHIVGRLSECKHYLQCIVIPPKYDMIQQQRQEILKKIEIIFKVLESKCSYDYEDEGISNTKKNLESLKGKVKRFSGAYQGVLYNQIEKDLKNLSLNAPAVIAEDIIKDVGQSLRILEHKATKNQSFRHTVCNTSTRNEDEEDKLTKIKLDLLDIKTTLDSAPTASINLFLELKSRLNLLKFGIDQLKCTVKEETNEKLLLYKEIETLKNKVEVKASAAKEAISQLSLEKDKDKIDLDALQKVEERFEAFKPEIESFIGTTSDKKFYELDENSIRLILRIDKLQFERGSEAQKRKTDLLKEIYSYGDLLDQRAKESEDLLDIENSVHDIKNTFAKKLKLSDCEILQEKLIGLKTRLDSTPYNNYLWQRKCSCAEAIEDFIEKVAEKAKNLSEEDIFQKKIMLQTELQFNDIKKNIDNIQETHADTEYQLISSRLTNLFLSLDSFNFPEDGELNSRKVKLLKEMHQYTEILNTKSKQNKSFQEVNMHLNSINQQIANYQGNGEELKLMENELKSLQSKVTKINNTEFNIKSLDKQLLALTEKYNDLRKGNEEQSSESVIKDIQNNLNENMLTKNTPGTANILLAKIENEINVIQKEVIKFVNSDCSEEYKTIEDSLLKLKMGVSKIDTGRNSEFIKRKHQLEQAIEECLSILDKRSLETAIVMELEEELDKIHEKLRDVVNESERSGIDEKLIWLQVRFGKLHVNEDLVLRKNKCGQRIVQYLKHLQHTHEQSNVAV